MNYRVIRIADPNCDCKYHFFSSLSGGNECRKIPIQLENGKCLNYKKKEEDKE